MARSRRAGGGDVHGDRDGADWSEVVDNGLPYPAVSALAFHPHDRSGGSIYGVVHGLGGPMRARLVKTTDGGTSWTPLPIPVEPALLPLRFVGGLAVAPDLAATVYLGDRNAVLTVEGDGARATVAPFSAGAVVTSVVVAPSSPNLLYAASAPSIHGIPVSILFRSLDHGATWVQLGFAETSPISLLAIDSNDPQIVFAAGRELHRSTDGGATWAASGPGGTVAGLAAGPGVVYAALVPTDASIGPAIWQSLDSGATWTQFADLPPAAITELVVDPEDPATLYAGTTAGVYVWAQVSWPSRKSGRR